MLFRTGFPGRPAIKGGASGFLSGPAMTFDFTSGVLDPSITFTRASGNATYYDATGVMQTAATNVPRFDYGPTPSGVTNWIRNSTMVGASVGVFPTNWVSTNINNITQSVVGVGIENGLSYIDVRWQGTANALGSVTNVVAAETTTGVPTANGQAWTLSCTYRLIAGDFSNVSQINMSLSQRTIAGGIIADFNSVIAPTSTTQRLSITATAASATIAFMQPKLVDISYANGAVIDFTLRISAPQLERGSTVSSFVSTSSAAANVGAVPIGLIIEDARTNLALNSGTLASALTYSNATGTAAQFVAPDGSATMSRMAEDGTTNIHFASTTVTVTASQLYTVSLYAAAQENRYLQIGWDDGGLNGVFATFDLQTGTVSGALTARGTGTLGMAYIQAISRGIYRISISGTHTNTSGRATVILVNAAAPAFAPSYAGNASNGLLIWGLQIENSFFATNYIPTVGSTVTRAVDVASAPLSPWYNAGGSGSTFHAECYAAHLPPSGIQQGVIRIDDTTSNNSSTIFCSSAANTVVVYGNSAGVDQINSFEASRAWQTAGINKVLVCWSSSAVWRGKTSGNAGESITGNTGNNPVSPTRILFGTSSQNNTSWKLNGQLVRVRYWSRQVSFNESVTLCT